MIAGADLMLLEQQFGSNYQDSAILLSRCHAVHGY
jgi:hypothetical protein